MVLFDRVKTVGRVQPLMEGCGETFSHLNQSEYTVFPGFCDVHVHFREPGFSYKETIETGAKAAAASGTTAVCMMPNLNPVPDSAEHLREEQERMVGALIRVLPYGSITIGEKGKELSDLEGLAPHVIAFSDDGVGVADAGLMREAMQRAKALGKLIAGHCEDMRFENPREREWREAERNIRLSEETGCAFHVCHVSTVETLNLVREAKKSGIDVSCETAPHYLLLDTDSVQDDGRFRMNPPLQTPADREALREGVYDGSVDMIATDHAPHSSDEKSRGFEKSLNGIIGIETAFPVLYTGLVRRGFLRLEQLVERMADTPRERFGIPNDGDFGLWDLNTEYRVDPAKFHSKARSTPFEGWQVYGRCLMTVHGGRPVFEYMR